MDFLKLLENESNKTYTTNGALTFNSTLNANLDLFSYSTRKLNNTNIVRFSSKLNKALNENKILATLNILYMLDIRSGKGERDSFKFSFKDLILKDLDLARKVLYAIPILGRWDYVLHCLDTPLEVDTLKLIKNQLNDDILNESYGEEISLLAKWLPSLRTHKKNNKIAMYLAKKLNLSFKEYRKTLKRLRNYLDIVETKITNQNNNIDFSKLPSKAHQKYLYLFLDDEKIYYEKYNEFKKSLKNNNTKINVNNLFMDEIISKMLNLVYESNVNKNDENLLNKVDMLNLMWDNQDNIYSELNENILVVADTSLSMDGKPYQTALALAIYFAEKNKGIYHNKFITFSSRPTFHKFEDNLTLFEKLKTINRINDNTDIDKVFELILNTSVKNKIPQNELPKKILIISDMEFDEANDSDITNFDYWKKLFNDNGYILPKIIFWNVANEVRIYPCNKDDENVVLISGYSKKLMENVVNLENFNPIDLMLETLEKYKKYL